LQCSGRVNGQSILSVGPSRPCLCTGEVRCLSSQSPMRQSSCSAEAAPVAPIGPETRDTAVELHSVQHKARSVTHTHLGDVQFRIGAHFSAQHSGLPHSYLQTARRCLAHCDDRPPNSGPARPCACSALVRYHRERSHDRPTASATHPDPCAPQEGRNMRAAHQLVQRSSKAGWLPFGTERDEVVVPIDQVQDLPRPNGSSLAR
jgi:hypothetical protein